MMAPMFTHILFVTRCLIFISEVCSTTAADEAETSDCRRSLDVAFLLDGSSDVTKTDWRSSLDVVTHVSSQLNTSLSGTHVGVLLFATNLSTVQPLRHQLLDLNDLSKSAQRGRNLAAALFDTRSLVFNSKDGDRPEVPDVLVIITHRVSDDPQASFVAAEQLKSDGIRIITVGIGTHEVDELKRELRAIATYPRESDKLITVHEYYHLAVLPALLLEAICDRKFDAAEGSVRLADESAASGRLEMFVAGEWITICSTSWTPINTDVACRELGFPAGLSWYTVNEATYSAQRRTMVGNVTCLGNESRLADCSHDPFFIVDSGCDHRRHVFLRCLCAHCNDYRDRDNLRLADRGSTYGRLEVFSPEHRWGGVCHNGWSNNNTKVTCRELGFLDGAGSYDNDDAERPTILVLGRVSCVGNESSLFDCDYHTMSSNNSCSLAVNIRCECSACLERHLLRSPREKQTTMGSSVQFEWKLNNSTGDDFEFWFLSPKNRRLVLRRTGGGLLTIANTELQKRVALIGDNETTVGFSLTNVSRADMGVFAIHVPRMKLFNSQAILFVTDFALVPDPEVHRQVHDSVKLSWDLTALRQLRDINHEILLTTPATGRLHLNYYYMYWLRDNPRRHSVPQSIDHLHPTIIIDDVTVKDAGNYVIEVRLTSTVHRWLNSSRQFVTLLVIDSVEQPASQSVIVIVLATLVAVLSFIVCGLLVRAACRRSQSTDDFEAEQVSASSRRGGSNVSRRYTKDDVDDKLHKYEYNVTEKYGEVDVEMLTLNNEQQQVSDDRTIDIYINEEPHSPPVPPISRSESTQLRRTRFANSSRRAK